MTPLEIAANMFLGLATLLAARNSIHSWWLGIVGCLLFSLLFFTARLYADVTLQIFFVATNITGWWVWLRGDGGAPRPVRRAPLKLLIAMSAGGLLVGLSYGAVLHHFTDAYAPFVDSSVLVLSVIAQLLLMWRMFETWPFWLAANSIVVPLYASRGLELTAVVNALYWLNSFHGGWIWYRELRLRAHA